MRAIRRTRWRRSAEVGSHRAAGLRLSCSSAASERTSVYDLLIPTSVRRKTEKKPMKPASVLNSPPGGSMTIMPLNPIPSEVKPNATQRAHSVKLRTPRMVAYL
jgi:hypothetical protein